MEKRILIALFVGVGSYALVVRVGASGLVPLLLVGLVLFFIQQVWTTVQFHRGTKRLISDMTDDQILNGPCQAWHDWYVQAARSGKLKDWTFGQLMGKCQEFRHAMPESERAQEVDITRPGSRSYEAARAWDRTEDGRQF